ncbi:MAG: response regulator transcription factor [Gammaproteobacteria bacterium]|nr:response regulator transcription factor [Gammaproteobacteria bacterium]
MSEEEEHAKPKPLLLVDDDETFCEVLSQALVKRNYDVFIAHNVSEAKSILETLTPDYAIVDLRMPKSSGLDLIPRLCEGNPYIRIVVLTGYASIATAIEAIKLGATHYLTKPADADEIVAAFDRGKGKTDAVVGEQPLALDRLEWEHIQKVLAECGGNISAAARRLKLHRRTLQRKLQKRPSGIE